MTTTEQAVIARIVAALNAEPDIARLANGVFVGERNGAKPPYVTLGPVLATDWGSKDRAGAEIMLSIDCRDRSEAGDRAMGLAQAAQRAILALRGVGADGEEIASVRLRRSQHRRSRDGEWAALLDFRIRVFAAVPG